MPEKKPPHQPPSQQPEPELDIDAFLVELNADLLAKTRESLKEADTLSAEIDAAVADRKTEIQGWTDAQKRLEILDTRDPFVLEILSQDQNFNIRILSLCNTHVPLHVLFHMIEAGDDYVKKIVAHNPQCTSFMLDRIMELSSESEVRLAVFNHPNVSQFTKSTLIETHNVLVDDSVHWDDRDKDDFQDHDLNDEE